jgi:hypothetical protein
MSRLTLNVASHPNDARTYSQSRHGTLGFTGSLCCRSSFLYGVYATSGRLRHRVLTMPPSPLVLSGFAVPTAITLLTGGVLGAACQRLLFRYRHGDRQATQFGFVGAAGQRGVAKQDSARQPKAHIPELRARLQRGRLALPPRVANMVSHEGAALDPVNCFVDALATLPRSEWLEIGKGVMAGLRGNETRAAAWAIVESTLRDRGLMVTAWYARDGVETAAFLATRHTARCSSNERRQMAAAQGAAEQAALALLVRDWLEPAEFELLYEPFAPHVPASSLIRS